MRLVTRMLVLLALVALAAPLIAQETGSISGMVNDANGQGVPGVSVKVSGPQMPAGRDVVTSNSGAYNVPRLVPGKYQVEASLTGLGTAVTKGVDVSVDRDSQVNLRLVQTATTEVTVTASAVEVDKKSNEVSTSFTAEEIRQLPLARTYAGLLQLVPGAADADNVGETAYMVSVSGGTRQDTKYQVDGVNITNPGYGSLDVQTNDIDIVDFDIKRGGISAEFGRTSGGLVNAVTRSGTNDFHGTVRFEALPDTFIAKPTGATTQKIDRYTGAGGVGFPIVHDQLFGYVSARYFSTTKSGQSSPYGTQPDSTLKNQDYFGKLTGYLGQSFLLNVGFRALPVKQENIFDSLNDAPTAGYNSDVTNYVGNATASFFLNKDSYLEAKYIHLSENNTSQAQNVLAGRPATIDPANLGAFGKFADPARSSGNSGYPEFANTGDKYLRDEIRLSASRFLDFGSHQHQVKIGAAYESDEFDPVRQTNGWGLFASSATCPATVCGPTAQSNRIRARYYTLQPEQIGKARTYSAFLQDTVTWGRLSINAGVLVNKDDFAQICEAGVVCGTTLVTDTTRYNFMTFGWDQEIQPRLGMVFNADALKGDKVYASFSRYASLDQKSTSRSFAPYRIRQDESYFDRVTGALLGQNVRGSSTGKYIPRDLGAPYYDEAIFGYEAPIANSFSVNAYYQYRALHSAFEDVPIDPDDYNGVTFPAGTPSFQAQNVAGASRYYRAVTIEVNKRLSNRWAGSFSYTYSELRGNFDEDASLLQFNTSSILEDGPGNNSAEANRYGTLSQDRPNIVKVFASYDTPIGVTLGGYYRYQSGSAWEARGRDGTGGLARYLEPAGSRRIPGWSNFDLLAAYNFRLGSMLTLRVEGRVLNVFNTQTGLTVDKLQYLDAYVQGTPVGAAGTSRNLGPQGTSQPNANFGNFTTYAQPRRFVATASVDF